MSEESTLPEGWEMVVGLETHVELATTTKLFCGCLNRFGDEPNTNICPVCLGLPGSLPVLNSKAVEYAMQIGLALNCTVEPSVFHRKNYFYPDMPKDFQTSQYDEPINVDGFLVLPDESESRVGIVRAHIEEDTGKTTHVGTSGRIHGATGSLVDYNRAGVPLVEIVSAPDISSAEQARAYVSELRAILVATGASDARMEEGSMRVDANVSVRRIGDLELGTRCEIKNLNSIRSIGRAIDYEALRQIELLEAGDKVIQQTRHWNDADGVTVAMRSKEEAEDYRYFQEPDLVPLRPSREWIESVQTDLAVLPKQRREQLASQTGMSEFDVAIVVQLGLDELVSGAIGLGAPAEIAVKRAANELAAELSSALSLKPADFAWVVSQESDSKLTSTQAKIVLAEMLESGRAPQDIAAEKGFEALDTSVLASAVADAIAGFPGEAQRLKEGEAKLVGFFVGKVMAATKGQADGKLVTQEIRNQLGL